MTFYNIIFGLLFIGAFREVIFALGGQPGWGVPDWRLFCRASILSILVFSDTIYTAVVIEDKRRNYSVQMKLLDLLSFILLSFAVVLLNPASNDMFEVNVTGTLQRVISWTGISAETMFWGLLAVYIVNLTFWNSLMGIGRVMSRHRWVMWVQPILAGAFLTAALLASKADGSFALVALRWILLGTVTIYLVAYKPHVCDILDKSITIRPLTEAQVQEIQRWPPYEGKAAALDYALRDKGWLRTYPARRRHQRFGIWQGDNLTGFALLVDMENGDAEYFVAIHPDRVGQGENLGREITERMVTKGFRDFRLNRIHLKVREHHPAKSIYEDVGFREVSRFEDEVDGQTVKFVGMQMLRPLTGLAKLTGGVRDWWTPPAVKAAPPPQGPATTKPQVAAGAPSLDTTPKPPST